MSEQEWQQKFVDATADLLVALGADSTQKHLVRIHDKQKIVIGKGALSHQPLVVAIASLIVLLSACEADVVFVYGYNFASPIVIALNEEKGATWENVYQQLRDGANE